MRRAAKSASLLIKRVSSANLVAAHRSCSTTTEKGAPAGTVAMDQEPEFEGEQPAASKETASSQQEEEESAAASPPPPVFLPSNYKPPTLKISTGLLRRLTSHDHHEVRLVYEAYLNYFTHMKFRKNWEDPNYSRDDTRQTWTLAAEYVVRIRNKLDEANPGQKLRMRDGAAQEFFHSADTFKLGDGTSFDFMVGLVHATMRDAIGYVEGLNKAKVDAYIKDITEYRYNPKMHAQHVLLEVQRGLDYSITKADTPQAAMELEANPLVWKNREDGYYLDTDAAGEKEDEADVAWRSGIGKLYEALGAIEKAEALMRCKFTQPPPSV